VVSLPVVAFQVGEYKQCSVKRAGFSVLHASINSIESLVLKLSILCLFPFKHTCRLVTHAQNTVKLLCFHVDDMTYFSSG
jgi:hypothetical protein